MSKSSLKIAAVFAVALIGGAAFFVFNSEEPEEPTEEVDSGAPVREVIGRSVEGREIEAYTYGSGSTMLLFVGGVHGGYEWNSVLLAYTAMDYLEANPGMIPEDVRVAIIPDANPDGTFKVIGKEGRFTEAEVPEDTGPVGSGRFNARDVDLNRNFDCKWQSESTWRGNPVSAGTAPFSEPEAEVIRNFVLARSPDAAIFWHSAAGAVYASECEDGILPETLTMMNAYAGAAGYGAIDTFDAYPITGDVEGWLASIGIPAVTVELKTHETVEWSQNLAGIKALFSLYAERS